MAKRRIRTRVPKAERQAAWRADVDRLAWERYGVELFGKEVEANLAMAFATQRSPQVTVAQLGARYLMVDLEAYTEAQANGVAQ